MEALVLSTEIIIMLGLLAFTIVLFAFELVRVDVAAICIMVLLGLGTMLPGIEPLIDPDKLFSGFSSNAVISVIAVMIIGAGLDKTGLMGRLWHSRHHLQFHAEHRRRCSVSSSGQSYFGTRRNSDVTTINAHSDIAERSSVVIKQDVACRTSNGNVQPVFGYSRWHCADSFRYFVFCYRRKICTAKNSRHGEQQNLQSGRLF